MQKNIEAGLAAVGDHLKKLFRTGFKGPVVVQENGLAFREKQSEGIFVDRGTDDRGSTCRCFAARITSTLHDTICNFNEGVVSWDLVLAKKKKEMNYIFQ